MCAVLPSITGGSSGRTESAVRGCGAVPQGSGRRVRGTPHTNSQQSAEESKRYGSSQCLERLWCAGNVMYGTLLPYVLHYPLPLAQLQLGEYTSNLQWITMNRRYRRRMLSASPHYYCCIPLSLSLSLSLFHPLFLSLLLSFYFSLYSITTSFFQPFLDSPILRLYRWPFRHF